MDDALTNLFLHKLFRSLAGDA